MDKNNNIDEVNETKEVTKNSLNISTKSCAIMAALEPLLNDLLKSSSIDIDNEYLSYINACKKLNDVNQIIGLVVEYYKETSRIPCIDIDFTTSGKYEFNFFEV